MSTFTIQDPALRRMVGIGGYYPGGLPRVIGDGYEEYPEGGPMDSPKMDADPYQQIPAGDPAPDFTMQPAMPPQQASASKKPVPLRRMMPVIGNMAMGFADGAATPNIAGGGGTDVMRAMQAGMRGKVQRDMQAYQMAAQQQQMEEMADYRRAQAEAARARAAASQAASQREETGSWINLGNGTMANTKTGEQRRMDGKTGAEMRIDAQAAAKEAAIQARKDAAIAAGLDPNSREFYAAVYGSAGAAVPRQGVVRGERNQSIFYTRGADGVPKFGAEVAGPPQMGKARGPNGETLFTEQVPGEGGRVVNSTPGVPPRAPGATRRVNAPPRETVTQKVGRLTAKVINDARSNGANTYGEVMSNVSQFYANDPEMAALRGEVLRRLQTESQGQDDMKLPGVTPAVNKAESDAAAAQMSAPAAAAKPPAPTVDMVRYKNGIPYKFNGQEWVPQGR